MNDSATPSAGYKIKEPLTITILGASGDLTLRKLMPALYVMYQQGFLPENFAIVGFARRDYSDKVFRELMLEALRKYSRLPVLSPGINEFLDRLYYHKGDISDIQSYKDLGARMDRDKMPANRLFYFSIKPDLFETALGHLHDANLIESVESKYWTRVVIEKPFGFERMDGCFFHSL